MRKIFFASVICLAALAMPASYVVSTAYADILCQTENFDTLKARPAQIAQKARRR